MRASATGRKRQIQMRREDQAADQFCTAFQISALFVRQLVGDFWGSLSISGVIGVYRRCRNAAASVQCVFCCTIHGEIHKLIEVLHLRAQIEQAYSSFS